MGLHPGLPNSIGNTFTYQSCVHCYLFHLSARIDAASFVRFLNGNSFASTLRGLYDLFDWVMSLGTPSQCGVRRIETDLPNALKRRKTVPNALRSYDR